MQVDLAVELARAVAAAIAPITAQMTALQAEFKAIQNETWECEECEMNECMDGAVTSSQQIPNTQRPAKTRKLKLVNPKAK